MPDRSSVIVAVIAFLAPVLRELLPRRGVPAIVFEIMEQPTASLGRAGLISVIVFPAIAFQLLERDRAGP